MKKQNKPRKVKSSTRPYLIILAFVAAAGGASLALTLRPTQVVSVPTGSEHRQVTAEDDMALIPTPTRAIAKGEKLSAVTFSKIKWPRSRMTGEFIADLADYPNAVALTGLPKLLPVPISAVSSEVADLNAVVEGIPEGMRAITVKVDAESAVEGWARAGNSVDVILIAQQKDSESGLEAKVIAENVKILSAGRTALPSNSGNTAPEAPKTVTLLTSQEDALKIKASVTLGKLTFSLRGQGDSTPASVMAVAQKSILGGPKTAQQKSAEPFRGVARDPDGRVFVLTEQSRWVENVDHSSVARVPERKQPLATTETEG